jgi:hypothetical protein
MVALAGCAHELPRPLTVPAPDSASSEELRWAIEAGLAAHNWTVHQRAPGTIRASVHSAGHGKGTTARLATPVRRFEQVGQEHRGRTSAGG